MENSNLGYYINARLLHKVIKENKTEIIEELAYKWISR